jgi:hypothetical protein
MTDEAIRENRDFVSMSNTDFEVLFDALDRTDEVQFRTLFTPLAQTNMVDLIRSQSGFGDDFHFIKCKRTNRILTKHSQGRETTLLPTAYHSHAFDLIRDNFIDKNTAYFKAIYFDFAPLLAIPIYQERPIHSLDPLPDYAQKYACKECESLANRALPESVLHPRTQTRAILKSAFLGTENEGDVVRISAFSYDIQKRVDIVPVYGGDGRWHNVHVPWDDYLPLERSTDFLVCSEGGDEHRTPVARRADLCMFTHK